MQFGHIAFRATLAPRWRQCSLPCSITTNILFGSAGIRQAGTMDAEKATKTESKFIKSEVVAKEKWLALEKITYTDPTGRERLWEAVSRTTKQGDGADAVVVVPIVKRKGKGDNLVVVKQFRPPVKGCTLEFPAGLIDKGEEPEVCAMRELKEETGYFGTAVDTSPMTCLDPGVGCASANIVTVEVDGDIAENSKAVATPDEGEFIETFEIPVANFYDEVMKMSKEGVMVDARVYCYALTLQHYKKFNFN